jgi:hypothetical protein
MKQGADIRSDQTKNWFTVKKIRDLYVVITSHGSKKALTAAKILYYA